MIAIKLKIYTLIVLNYNILQYMISHDYIHKYTCNINITDWLIALAIVYLPLILFCLN